MENSILLQKQIRDNAQDLHSYMRDLSNWEKDMKRKESEFTGEPIEQDLPPVRSKTKKSKAVNLPKKPVKKLAGFDYAAWDKFDADKACEMVDEEDIGPTSLDGKMSAEQKLEKLKEEAHEEKEKGNKFVKLQKWDEAIACYTRAIELNKFDAIYYANRGLCYLKKENLHAAESDCSKALDLDPKYVKALQRRSCAREALGSLRRAASDLREILVLEPGNVIIKKQLLALTQRMGTKGPNSKSSPATTPLSENPPVNGIHDLKSSQTAEMNRTTVSGETNRFPTPQTNYSAKVENNSAKKNDPKSQKNVSDDQVLPINKPPHLRSKKPLIRIPIMEIPLGTSETAQPKTHGNSKSVLNVTDSKSDNEGQLINGNNNKVLSPKSETVMKNQSSQFEINGNIESVDMNDLQLDDISEIQVPKSSVQFLCQWRFLKGREKHRSKYLKAIAPAQLPAIFQNYLESDVLSEIIEVLCGEDFNQPNSSPIPYLENLSKVKRFCALAMFLSDKEKTSILKILQRYKESADCSDITFEEIKTKYEL